MAHLPVAHRKLFMHSAHPTVGVSRSLSLFRPTLTSDAPAAYDGESLSVRLILGEIDGQIATVLLAFQRMLQARFRVDCRLSFVDVAEGVTELDGIDASDCTVLLCHGITVLQDRDDWDPELFADGSFHAAGQAQPEIAVVPGERWHPVLQGVGPFVSRSAMPAHARTPADGVPLLLGQAGEATVPVAWAKTLPGHRQFHTTLGCADDFRHSSFCRVLANAVAWVGCYKTAD